MKNFHLQTRYEFLDGMDTCVYCGNTNLVIDDEFDQYGNYISTVYYCTCDKAKAEQAMNLELLELEKKKEEITKAYEERLAYDRLQIGKLKIKDRMDEIIFEEILDTELRKITVEDFVEIAREAYTDRLVSEED